MKQEEKKIDSTRFRPDLKIFGVQRTDPGWVYVIQNGALFKIGKTTSPHQRIERDAKTWLPDLKVIGIKPFWDIAFVERSLHAGLARNWYSREWYKFDDPNDWEFFSENFNGLYDDDRDWNSVDFIYWMNSSGMAEFCHELVGQSKTLPSFHRYESNCMKKVDGS